MYVYFVKHPICVYIGIALLEPSTYFCYRNQIVTNKQILNNHETNLFIYTFPSYIGVVA